MSKPIPKPDVDSAVAKDQLVTFASSRRKLLLYATPLLSGGALVAVIYLLRLDAFRGWEKALVDLLMVAIAVTFFVSLYMAVDSIVRGVDRGEERRSGKS